MTEYQQLLDAVEQYYGSGSDQWAEIAKYGVASENAESILSQVPGVNIVKNANGKIRSYNFAPTENIVSGAEQAVNSNTPAVIKSFEVPANTALDTAGKMTFKSGMAQAGNFVFTEVAPAIAAAGAGITLGKTFDKLLYNWDPDFWDEHGMSTLNPDVWGDIIGTDSAGARIANVILGTTPDNKTQAYIDQNALAYMALYMQNKGVFETGSIKINSIENEELSNKLHFPIDVSKLLNWGWIRSNKKDFRNTLGQMADNSIVIGKNLIAFTNKPNTKYYGASNGASINYIYNPDNPSQIPTSYDDYTTVVTSGNSGTGYTHNGKEVFVTPTFINTFDYGTIVDIKPVDNNANAPILKGYEARDIAWAALYGDTTENPAIDGIGTQDNAKTPDLSNADTVEDVLNALKSQYPELFQNAVTQDVVQPDGSTVTYTYVPIAVPELDPEGNPISSPDLDPEGNPIGSTQANPQIDPATAPEPLLKLITTLIQKDPPINPPDTGSGDSPIVVIPTGSANALYSIYNPSQAQLNSFGAWLWSSNFVDQLLKLFNDPMQAIIGLHKVFASPSISGTGTIKVGYLDSGVSSNIVGSQYTTVDCGSVSLSEYFGNVFDYDPYTKVNLYLPFIGIVPLSVGEVMRSTIHVVYHVDVLTGACLAEVKIKRDSAGGTLFQYSGNAAVQYPISSGSYMGIISGIMSIAGGVAGTIATGGAAMPVLLGAGASVGRMHTDISHSGSFSGNAGAMGIKKPYLIIDRPQTALAKNFPNYIGYPSNTTVKLSSCHGFTKVKEVHLENVPATNNELSDIEMKLKGGVII